LVARHPDEAPSAVFGKGAASLRSKFGPLMLTIVVMNVTRWCHRILVFVVVMAACLPIRGVAEAAPGPMAMPLSGCCEDCDDIDDSVCMVTFCASQPAMVAPTTPVVVSRRARKALIVGNEQAYGQPPEVEPPPPRPDMKSAAAA
jgi:hypothetical protein